MSQPAESFTRPGPAGQRGTSAAVATTPSATARAARRSATSTATIGFVKNEPTLRRFGSPASMTMDLRRRSASTASRVARERRRARRDRARRRARGSAASARRRAQAEGHAEHDVALGRAPERAVAVGEGARRGRQLDDRAVAAIDDAHGADRLGDLLAVGADVLDRRRAREARDARQALEPGQAARDGLGDERRPTARPRPP